MGVQPDIHGKEYWAFACSYHGPKRAHIFLALPPRDAPSNVEELQAWIHKQELTAAGLKPTKTQS